MAQGRRTACQPGRPEPALHLLSVGQAVPQIPLRPTTTLNQANMAADVAHGWCVPGGSVFVDAITRSRTALRRVCLPEASDWRLIFVKPPNPSLFAARCRGCWRMGKRTHGVCELGCSPGMGHIFLAVIQGDD